MGMGKTELVSIMNEAVPAMLLDRDDTIVECSRAVADFFGLSQDSLLGRSVKDFLSDHDLMKLTGISGVVDKEGPIEFNVAFVTKRQNGLVAHCFIEPCYNDEGRHHGTFLVVRGTFFGDAGDFLLALRGSSVAKIWLVCSLILKSRTQSIKAPVLREIKTCGRLGFTSTQKCAPRNGAV